MPQRHALLDARHFLFLELGQLLRHVLACLDTISLIDCYLIENYFTNDIINYKFIG